MLRQRSGGLEDLETGWTAMVCAFVGGGLQVCCEGLGGGEALAGRAVSGAAWESSWVKYLPAFGVRALEHTDGVAELVGVEAAGVRVHGAFEDYFWVIAGSRAGWCFHD